MVIARNNYLYASNYSNSNAKIQIKTKFQFANRKAGGNGNFNVSNKNTLERVLGIGLVDKVEREGEICYCISKREKSLMDGLNTK